MNWNIARENWGQFRMKVKAEWSCLTDFQLDCINGRRPVLSDTLQRVYGFNQTEAEQQILRFELGNRRNSDFLPRHIVPVRRPSRRGRYTPSPDVLF